MPVRLKMTNCASTTDVIVMQGVDKALYPLFRRHDLPQGILAEFNADRSGALVGGLMASRYGWRLGDHVTLARLGDISFTVRGIIPARGGADDLVIVVDRSYLQEVDGQLGVSHHVLVKLKPDADPTAVSRAIEGLPLTVDVHAKPERAALAAALAQLADLVPVGLWVVSIILVVILLGMGNAMTIATRDRTQEFGVMRTLGFPRGSILWLVLGEGVLVALGGAVIGALGVQLLIASGAITTVYSCGLPLVMSMGSSEWLLSVGLVAMTGALATVLPALNAMRLDVVTALGVRE
jgi:putative ABC transport system permease protein